MSNVPQITRPRAPGPRPVPAAVSVLLAVAALAASVLTALLLPGGPDAAGHRAEVGEEELVRVTGPDGTAVMVLAQISTGVAGSAIDTELADELNLPRTEADRVTVTSAYGVQIRDRVPATVQLAGQPQSTRLVAVDREPGEPALTIGRSELGGLLVRSGMRLLSDPGPARDAPVLGALLTSSTALDAVQVLALIPVAALLVVVLRTVVGLRTLGTFSPVLLSLGYTQSGLEVGLGLTAVLLVAGLVAVPVLAAARMPRIARLAVLVGIVSVVLVGVTHLAGPGVGSGWSTALPVVVTAVVVERLWEVAELDGWRRAGGEALQTLAVAVGVTLLLFVPAVGNVASEHPLSVATAALLAAGLTGTYRGARLLDRWSRPAAPAVAVPASAPLTPTT